MQLGLPWRLMLGIERLAWYEADQRLAGTERRFLPSMLALRPPHAEL